MAKHFVRKVDDAAPFVTVRFDGVTPNHPAVPDGSFVRIYPNEDTPDALVDALVERLRKDGAAAVVKMSKPRSVAPHVSEKKAENEAKDARRIVDEFVDALPATVDKQRVRAFIFDALETAGV